MQEWPALPKVSDIQCPRHFCQLGVLLLDGSRSMLSKTKENVTKAEATARATRELFDRFKNGSRIKHNFQFALVAYDHRATPVIDPPVAAAEVDERADYNPARGHGGGTLIWRALEEAERIVGQFFASAPRDGVPRSAVILLMTDGLCLWPNRTREAARRIRDRFGSRVTLAGAFFSSNTFLEWPGQRLLREIVDDPGRYFATASTGDQLRDFFTETLVGASRVGAV